MEQMDKEVETAPVRSFNFPTTNRFFLAVIIASIILGIGAGYFLANSNKSLGPIGPASSSQKPITAQQDSQTFRDFAEGTIQKIPTPTNSNDYTEGTHLLIRDGAVPVALTSSVVDLSLYEGKKVKVFGETQKALKAGWLMDVGKVEVE